MLASNVLASGLILSILVVKLTVGQKWNGQATIRERVSMQEEGFNRNVAKNIILFLGDGMGVATVTAGRILKGQMQNKTGEETVLSMDSLPHTSILILLTAKLPIRLLLETAYLCGVKTKDRVLGLNGKINSGECLLVEENKVKSVLVEAYEAGKATGFVTTTRVTHATPAASYAHCPHREWEADSLMPQEAKGKGCKDIAQQFVDISDKITVAMGGGRQNFMQDSMPDPEYPNQTGLRSDGQNLIQTWLDNAKADEKRQFVCNQADFDNINPTTVDKLLGHMQYEVDRNTDGAGEPSLSEMTEKALKVLRKNSNGYFLLVEDHGHHGANAYTALHDFVEFDRAVGVAKALTSESDTLIVVTADHSHTMSLGGYAERGNSIFALAPAQDSPGLAKDNLPYTTLLYGNGPGYKFERENLTSVDTEHRQYKQQTPALINSETHAGEDVGIYASGPFAHLFHGVHEQNYIPHVFRYASCIGGVTEHCDGASSSAPSTSTKLPITDAPAKVNFIGYQLPSADATVALYVNFVLVISLVFFGFILASLSILRYYRSSKISSSVEGNGITYSHYDVAL